MHDVMTNGRQREIVIEFEKVQLVRKRAKTNLAHCHRCNAESDFVGIAVAADLFGITVGDLTQFVVNSAVHYANQHFGTAICIASLLGVMHEKQNGKNTPLIGNGQNSGQ